MISQDMLWLESLPLLSRNVKLSIQSWKPVSPEDSLLLEDGTSSSTKEEQAAADGAEGRDILGVKTGGACQGGRQGDMRRGWGGRGREREQCSAKERERGRKRGRVDRETETERSQVQRQ